MSRGLHCLAVVLLLLLSSVLRATVSTKQPCETCKKLVEQFHKGLEDTAKKNFGGGNTAWEEKTLSKYETSEIRLVEIIENLCDTSDFECNNMVEEHEEEIEKWWFKMKKKHSDLLKWFCIETIKVCCSPGTYGPDCLACLGGSERPCHGNGFCKGDGTRSGDGSCSCKIEYTGEFCLDCAEGYYSTEKNDTHAVCTACHPACKTCTGATNHDCKNCNEGWIKNEDVCVDVDECAVEEPPCGENKYCLNSEGSYECKDCDRSCAGCTGGGADKCEDCNSGYTLEEEKCTDVDECAVEDSPCKENEYCFNTEGSYECKVCDQSCTGCTGEGSDKCNDCTSGYSLEEGKCTDVNECASGEPVCLGENEDCANTPGSYKCTCFEGYEDKDGRCVQKEPEAVMEAKAQSDEVLQAEPGESYISHEDL